MQTTAKLQSNCYFVTGHIQKLIQINQQLSAHKKTKYQNHMTFSFLVITALRCHLKLKVKPVRYLPEAQLPADHVTGCVVKQIIADRSPGVIVQHFHTSNERALTSFQPDVITHCTCTHVHFYTRYVTSITFS